MLVLLGEGLGKLLEKGDSRKGNKYMTPGVFRKEDQQDFDQWFGKKMCIPNDQDVTALKA